MATFYLFVIIAIKQFVKMSVYDVPYFQADSILLMGAKYRINTNSITRDTNKEKGERSMLTPLSD
jgi:hypothetical protein